ncbi:penicillin-binding protein activator LpoB [Vibrio sp. SS-MA-C1-2]|uniref:penicillin-binding protein activator LpoB n=1 Tax=Vibrio sp. SS-MA-C1-2 TaxID=2908646 RepID=UPI001F4499E7|nr:penicillin-binding protein activator LpoB [Vibrio sp. SS-MA-C1-2]UJF17415.1 penicillin-binding protein activator LpoB [Vibrio sp. SS-MA-C1-2]
MKNLFISLSLLLLVGCTNQNTSQKHSGTQGYNDHHSIVKTEQSPQPKIEELEPATRHLVHQIVESGEVAQVTTAHRPVIFIKPLRNRTNDYVDIDLIEERLASELLDSRLFRFVESDHISEAREQLELDSDDQLVDKRSAVRFSRMIGAEIMLDGDVLSVRNSSLGQLKIYKLRLKMVNINSGVLIWQGENSFINPQ